MGEPDEGNSRYRYRAAAGRLFSGVGALASEMGEFKCRLLSVIQIAAGPFIYHMRAQDFVFSLEDRTEMVESAIHNL
jgi:hypothetical protein